MSGRRSGLAVALRMVRQPVVALCAVLILSNLLIPAASVGVGPAAAGVGHMCHGAAPTSPDEDGGPGRHPFQTCCFSATVALLPAALLGPSASIEGPSATIRTVAERIRTVRAAGAARIRAPPFS